MKKSALLIIIGIGVFLLIKSLYFNSAIYEITFDAFNGKNILTQNVRDGEKIKRPDNPTKEGYIFKEWQLNGEIFDFDTEVHEDIVLYGIWEFDTKGYDITTREGLRDFLIKILNTRNYSSLVNDYILGIFDRLYQNYPSWKRIYKDLPNVNDFIMNNLIMVIPNIETIDLYLNGTKEADEIYEVGAGYTSKNENDQLYIKFVYYNYEEFSEPERFYYDDLEGLFHEIIHCKQLVNDREDINSFAEKNGYNANILRGILIEGGATFNARFISDYTNRSSVGFTTCMEDLSMCFQHGKESGIGVTYIGYMHSYDLINYLVGYDNINRFEKGTITLEYLNTLLKEKVTDDLFSLMISWCDKKNVFKDISFNSAIELEKVFIESIKKDISNLDSYEDVKRFIDVYRGIKRKILPSLYNSSNTTNLGEDNIIDRVLNIDELDELLIDKILKYDVFNRFSNNDNLSRIAIKTFITSNSCRYYTNDGIYSSIYLPLYLDDVVYNYFEEGSNGHMILKYYQYSIFEKKDELIYLEFVFNEDDFISIKEASDELINKLKQYENVYN